MRDFLAGTVDAVGLSFWAIFVIMYIAYGNRLHAPAGRALVTMSFGYMLTTLTLTLRHPFNLSTSNSTFFSWFQIVAVGTSCLGTVSMLWLLVKAQGRWPWRKLANVCYTSDEEES